MAVNTLVILSVDESIGDGGSLIQMGVLFLAVAIFAIWRGRLRSKAHTTTAEPPMNRPGAAAQSQQKRLDEIEVRLYDYGREVEGRIETRLAMLDELMIQAERETDRLEELLERTELKKRQFGESTPEPQNVISLPTRATPKSSAGDEPLHFTPLQREMIVTLYQTGFRVNEIAQCMERTVSDIERVLELYGGGPSSHAA